MRRSLIAIVVLATAACVDVPDAIRAEFAAPGPADRSNYRPGRHGSAPPVEDAPEPKAGGPAAPDSDASAPPGASDGASPSVSPDGGALEPVGVDGGSA